MADTPAGYAGDIEDSSMDYRDLSVLEVLGTIGGAFLVMGLLILFTTWIERRKEKQHADSVVMENLRNQRQSSHADIQLPSRVMNFKREKTLAMVQRVVAKRVAKPNKKHELEDDELQRLGDYEFEAQPSITGDLNTAPSGSFASLPAGSISPTSRSGFHRRTSFDSASRKARLAKEMASIRKEERRKSGATPPRSPQASHGSILKNSSFDSPKPSKSSSITTGKTLRRDSASDALALLQDDGTTIMTSSGTTTGKASVPTGAQLPLKTTIVGNNSSHVGNTKSRLGLEPSTMTATRHKSEEQRLNHLTAALASLQAHEADEQDLAEVDQL